MFIIIIVVVIVLAHHLNSWSLKAASEILIVVHAKVLWTKILLLRQIHEILIIKHRGKRERPDEFIENLLLLGLPIVRLWIIATNVISVRVTTHLNRILIWTWNLNNCSAAVSIWLSHYYILRRLNVLVASIIWRHHGNLLKKMGSLRQKTHP